MNIKYIRLNIKNQRKAAGITQKDMANRLFMDERTYSKIERGEKKSIDIALLAAIADILHTNIPALIICPEGELDEDHWEEQSRALSQDLMAPSIQDYSELLKEIRNLKQEIVEIRNLQKETLDFIKITT